VPLALPLSGARDDRLGGRRGSRAAGPMSARVEFAASVHRSVRRIPYGMVASYGDIAVLAGRPRAARGVGGVLRELPQGSDVPWWRVVAASGTITNPSPGGDLQRMLLLQEGVLVRGRRIDLDRYRWRPNQRTEG
jgi:methylated-DNA-protein-cysteine methyltransferase related protein